MTYFVKILSDAFEFLQRNVKTKRIGMMGLCQYAPATYDMSAVQQLLRA